MGITRKQKALRIWAETALTVQDGDIVPLEFWHLGRSVANATLNEMDRAGIRDPYLVEAAKRIIVVADLGAEAMIRSR